MLRRYRRLRRRPLRIRRRRRLFPRRRRRLFIRRPTAGAYYTRKYETTNQLSFGKPPAGKNWYLNGFSTTLGEWTTHSNFEYYKVLKMKLTFRPRQSAALQQTILFGHTLVDLDGHWPTAQAWADNDPYDTSSSARPFTSARRHSRYFTPKPFLVSTTAAHPGQSLFFTNRQVWCNTYDPTIKWGGLLFSIFVNNEHAQGFWVTKSVWIRFRTVL